MRAFLIFTTLLIYEILGSIYLLLPPLLGVGFVLFIQFLNQKKYKYLALLVVLLLLFDIQKDHYLLSTLSLFLLAYLFIPHLETFFGCQRCLLMIFVSVAYLGHYLFLLLVYNILWLDGSIEFSWYTLYYMIFELFLVLML